MTAIIMTNVTDGIVTVPSWHTPPHDLCLTRHETAFYPVDLTKEQYDQWFSSEPVIKLVRSGSLLVGFDPNQVNVVYHPGQQVVVRDQHRLPKVGELWTDEYLLHDPDSPHTNIGRVGICGFNQGPDDEEVVAFWSRGKIDRMAVKDFVNWFVKIKEPVDRMRAVLEHLAATLQEISDLDACYRSSNHPVAAACSSAAVQLYGIRNSLWAAFGPV